MFCPTDCGSCMCVACVCLLHVCVCVCVNELRCPRVKHLTIQQRGWVKGLQLPVHLCMIDNIGGFFLCDINIQPSLSWKSDKSQAGKNIRFCSDKKRDISDVLFYIILCRYIFIYSLRQIKTIVTYLYRFRLQSLCLLTLSTCLVQSLYFLFLLLSILGSGWKLCTSIHSRWHYISISGT